MNPRLSRRTVLQSGALSALTLLVAACGGDDGDSDATTTAASSTPDDTTPDTGTEPVDTTPEDTVDVESTSGETTTTRPGQTTIPAPTGPVYPLTGLPITDELRAQRPAMAVKIDNHPQARPQFGLNKADIVFEENVESLTRFAAIFQSQDLDRVGPVRSGRTQDVDLLAPFSEPMFVWSGGNGAVTRAINNSELVSLSPTTTKNVGFFRQKRGSETSEHTLYANPIEIYGAFTRVFAPAPGPQFVYREAGEAFNGEKTTGVDIDMDGAVDVNWTWDAESTSYLRSTNGDPHEDATDGQVNAANVVVLEVEYKRSAADRNSPEAQTIGSGTAWVFTGGVMVAGTWQRSDRLLPFELVDADGTVITLTPGRTWVELARLGTVAPVA
jgi:hypothetical protein